MTLIEINEKYGKIIDSITDFRKEIKTHLDEEEFTNQITKEGLYILKEVISALGKSQDTLEDVDELEG